MRNQGDGGEDSRNELAPVIPLFGDRGVAAGRGEGRGRAGRQPAETSPADSSSAKGVAIEGPSQERWHTTWGDDAPLQESAETADIADLEEAGVRREAAAKALVKRLRGRSLSVVEARAVLVEHGLDHDEAGSVLDEFVGRGYLDDLALAEQIMHVGVDRKGQGRQVISLSMARRGIPRDVADRALAEMPDDDAERALAFAQSKARSMGTLDHETALRRLTGQLVRRGYRSGVALTAARGALGISSSYRASPSNGASSSKSNGASSKSTVRFD